MAISLKAARVNADLTQKEAADLIGVTPETVLAWEKGRSFPTVDKLPKILETYRVTFDDLIFLPSSSV